MNLNPSQYGQPARIWVLCCLIAAGIVAFPSASSAMSLVAAHAPDGPVHVALVRHQSGPAIAVSRSVGLMVGTDGTRDQASLGQAPVEVTRSVGLMTGAGGTETQAELGTAPVVTRAIGLMEGAQG